MFFEAISASLLVLIVNLIDLFTVSVAILVEGKHGKIYNKCMVKVGSLMLYNLRILEESSHSEISMIYQLKILVKQLTS